MLKARGIVMEWITNILNSPPALVLLGLAILSGGVSLIIWYANVNSDRASFRVFVNEVKGDIKKILWALDPTTRPVERGSAIRLSEYGKKVRTEINADEAIKPVVAKIAEKVKGYTFYAIQEECLRYARQDFLGDIRVSHKTLADLLEVYAYTNGIDISIVLEVIGVVLRDKVFDRLGLHPPS